MTLPSLASEVLTLANFKNARKGEAGVSDHAPILLKITQSCVTK